MPTSPRFRLSLHLLDNALVVRVYRSIAVAVTRSCKTKHSAVMQALLRTVALLALMPASGLLAPTISPRRAVHVSAKKKPATAGGFGAAAPSTPKKKKKKIEDDEPGLARPWDTPDDEGEETRAQKRGSKKIGKRGAGAAPQPSGGMSAGVKLN